MKDKILLQINTVLTSNATGRIAEEIGLCAMSLGWKSVIAYGRNTRPSGSMLLKIGSPWGIWMHWLISRIFDAHGLGSRMATRKLIRQIQELEPSIIHLHNIHGYYLNYPLLFDFLAKNKIPVVWTLHDCWAMTGHCSHFDYIKCDRWKTKCDGCSQKNEYPRSIGFNRALANFECKKRLFGDVKNLTIVAVSDWLAKTAKESFLNSHRIIRIYNGIDLDKFHSRREHKESIASRNCLVGVNYILSVANPWSEKKGLTDFYRIRKKLSKVYEIVLVGMSDEQLQALPSGITGIKKTEQQEELRILYAHALAFVNLTLEDSFPTTNLEALACGTPVITYHTGGSVEAATAETGRIVAQGDLDGVVKAIVELSEKDRSELSKACRNRAEGCFNKKDRFREYIDLYEELITNT